MLLMEVKQEIVKTSIKFNMLSINHLLVILMARFAKCKLNYRFVVYICLIKEEKARVKCWETSVSKMYTYIALLIPKFAKGKPKLIWDFDDSCQQFIIVKQSKTKSREWGA